MEPINRRHFLRNAAGLPVAGFRPGQPADPHPRADVLETRVISWLHNYYHGWPTLARRRDGQLVLVYSGGREGHVCPFGRVEMMVSKDDGRAWTWPRVLLDGPLDDRDAGVMETSRGTLLVTTSTSLAYQATLETAGGRILVHIRNENSENSKETLQSESDDSGRTWSVPHPIGVWGLPSFLLRLGNGTLLMTYGHRRPPLGIQARTSRDLGTSWSAPLIIADDGTSSDLGYPSTVELPDGSLLTVWYELLSGSPRAILRQAHWRLAA